MLAMTVNTCETEEEIVFATTLPEIVPTEVVCPVAKPPDQVNVVAAPPEAQLAANVTLPPPAGRDEGLAVTVHEAGLDSA